MLILVDQFASAVRGPGPWLYFAMGIHVPASAPLGKNGLFWQLDPTGAQFPETVSGLAVSG